MIMTMEMIMMIFFSFLFALWLTNEKRLASFTARPIVRDSYHCTSPKHREQDLKVCRTFCIVLVGTVIIPQCYKGG